MSGKRFKFLAVSARPGERGEPLSRMERFKRVVVVTRRVVGGLYESGITRMAAALAYRTIFSIIPVLAIGLLIFGSVVSEDQVDAGVRRVLDFAGVSQINVSESYLQPQLQGPVIPPEEIPGPGVEEAVEAVEAAHASAEIEEIISDLVVRVNETLQDLPKGWIALVTGVVLLYAALSMLIEVEKAFNQVCGAPVARSWMRRVLLYWTMLTLGAVLLTATFWTGDALAGFVRGSGGSALRSSLAGYGASVLISTVLLVVAYLSIPTVRLRLRSVLAGAFMAAVVWEMGKWGFTSYLRYSTGYAQFYGSLALLPLFLLWVYVTWVIVLLGLQAAYALEHFSQLMLAGAGPRHDGPRLVDPAAGLSVAAALVRTHRQGRTPDAGDISAMVALETTVVEALLRRLERAGLVRRVVVEDDDTGWIPARPAERIGLDEVLEASADFEASRGVLGENELLVRLADARRDAARGRTLAQAVPDTGEDPAPGANAGPRAG